MSEQFEKSTLVNKGEEVTSLTEEHSAQSRPAYSYGPAVGLVSLALSSSASAAVPPLKTLATPTAISQPNGVLSPSGLLLIEDEITDLPLNPIIAWRDSDGKLHLQAREVVQLAQVRGADCCGGTPTNCAGGGTTNRSSSNAAAIGNALNELARIAAENERRQREEFERQQREEARQREARQREEQQRREREQRERDSQRTSVTTGGGGSAADCPETIMVGNVSFPLRQEIYKSAGGSPQEALRQARSQRDQQLRDLNGKGCEQYGNSADCRQTMNFYENVVRALEKCSTKSPAYSSGTQASSGVAPRQSPPPDPAKIKQAEDMKRWEDEVRQINTGKRTTTPAASGSNPFGPTEGGGAKVAGGNPFASGGGQSAQSPSDGSSSDNPFASGNAANKASGQQQIKNGTSALECLGSKYINGGINVADNLIVNNCGIKIKVLSACVPTTVKRDYPFPGVIYLSSAWVTTLSPGKKEADPNSDACDRINKQVVSVACSDGEPYFVSEDGRSGRCIKK
ncbi:MAG: hypothetical protein ABTQ26_15710 [Azonexus sp.]